MNDKINRFNDSRKYFRCPVCGNTLLQEENSLRCSEGHCYDIAKTGYVNFDLSARQTGLYSRESFQNRQVILEAGYYAHILEEIQRRLERLKDVKTVLDAGCGNGYYARAVSRDEEKTVIAFDLSKDAVKMASKSDTEGRVRWFVGDLTDLPVKNHSIDCILDIFSPANYKEFDRVLKKKGCIIKVVPGEGHLKEFRAAAKDQLINEVYSNEDTVEYFGSRFNIVSRKMVSKTFSMSPEHIRIFAGMTPLFFHVDVENVDLDSVTELTVEAEVLVGRRR